MMSLTYVKLIAIVPSKWFTYLYDVVFSTFPQKEHETKVKWENFVFVQKPGVLYKSFKVAKTRADDIQIQTNWREEIGGKYWVLHKSPTNVNNNANRVRIFHLTNIDTFQPKIDKLHLYIKKLISLQSFISTFWSAELRAD